MCERHSRETRRRIGPQMVQDGCGARFEPRLRATRTAGACRSVCSQPGMFASEPSRQGTTRAAVKPRSLGPRSLGPRSLGPRSLGFGHSRRASARSAKADTSVRLPATIPARNRGRPCPRDDNGGGGQASATRRPTGRIGRSPDRHTRNRSAGGDIQSRREKIVCSGRPSPGRARRGEGRWRRI